MEKKIDLRIAKTYRLLHVAFTEILEEKSLEEMTVGELCERAMVRRNTFYLHFADKYEYFYFYLSELRDEFRERAEIDKTNPSPVAYSAKMLVELFKFVSSHEKSLERLKNSTRLSFLYMALQEQISHEIRYAIIDRHNKKNNVDIDMIVAFYSGGLINIIYWWIENPQPLTEEQLAERIINLFPAPNLLLE